MIRALIASQAIYYCLTGLWPLVSMSTFEAVTGPKTDDWLVHMVGLLAASIGASLGVGVYRGHPGRETVVLSIASILSFAAIDLVYALNGTISRIYLADAVVQGLLLAGILLGGTAWDRRVKRE